MHYRDPLSRPVSGLRREIDQLFQDAFGGGEGGRGGGGGGGGEGRAVRGWTPAVEIREDEDELIFEFDLPGVRSDDVEVTSDRGVLVVRGHRQAQRSEGPGRIHVTERAYGEFGRFFQLPQTVDEERIEASFEDGVLTVRVPKAELARPRKIQIRTGGGSEGRGSGSGGSGGGGGSAGGGGGGGGGRHSGEVRGSGSGGGRGGAIGGGGGAGGRRGGASSGGAGGGASGASGAGGGSGGGAAAAPGGRADGGSDGGAAR